MKVNLSKKEIQRIWEYDRYIFHKSYTELDRKICLKFRKLLDKK